MINAFQVAQNILRMHYKVLIDNKNLHNEYFLLARQNAEISIDILIESKPSEFTPEFWQNVKDEIKHFQPSNLLL